MIIPIITSRLPRIRSAQVAWFSQPGRMPTVLSRRTPGCAAGFITTRLYLVSRNSVGLQSSWPMPAFSQKFCRPGSCSGAMVPGRSALVIGSAPVPRSIEEASMCGTSARYRLASAAGAMPMNAGAPLEFAVSRRRVSPMRTKGASLRSSASKSLTTTAYPEVATRCMSPVNAPPGSRCCIAAQNAAPTSSVGSPAVSTSMPRIVRNIRNSIAPFSVILRRPYRPK